MIDTIVVQYIVAGTIAFLILVNIILSLNEIKNDTINYILKSWAYGRYFFITFAWGVLGGHFFLGTKSPVFGNNWWLPVVLVILILFLLFYIGQKQRPDFVMSRRVQFLLLLTGVLYGHFFWSQRHLDEITFPFLN